MEYWGSARLVIRSKGNRRPDDWLGNLFRSRVSAVGSQVQVFRFGSQVQDLHFIPYPYLYLKTRTRDLRTETWDPGMSHVSR
jgi:hypothetical protein